MACFHIAGVVCAECWTPGCLDDRLRAEGIDPFVIDLEADPTAKVRAELSATEGRIATLGTVLKETNDDLQAALGLLEEAITVMAEFDNGVMVKIVDYLRLHGRAL